MPQAIKKIGFSSIVNPAYITVSGKAAADP
jgi:hypothetical protein